MYEAILHMILLAFLTLIKSQQAGKSNLLGEDIANFALVVVGIAASNLVGIYATFIANTEDECYTCYGLEGYAYYGFFFILISVSVIWASYGTVYLF